MKVDKSAEECCRKRKAYHSPEVIVYGDVKEITLNSGTTGLGDASYEGKECSSPGNCGG